MTSVLTLDQKVRALSRSLPSAPRLANGLSFPSLETGSEEKGTIGCPGLIHGDPLGGRDHLPHA